MVDNEEFKMDEQQIKELINEDQQEDLYDNNLINK
jgi:hypothetical protein